MTAFNEPPKPAETFHAKSPPRIHLLSQFYEPSWAHRAEEIRTCLIRNFENPQIFRIHLFDETPGLDEELRERLAEKLVYLPSIGQRLTFQQAADYADQALEGEICVLANADVYFDDSLSELARLFGDEMQGSGVEDEQNRLALALLRHDVGEEGQLELREINSFSQDAWCFVPPVRVRDADVHLGTYACDNRFAWELRRAGFRLRNPCCEIKVCHLHRDEAARQWRQQARAAAPYLLVEPELDLEAPEPLNSPLTETPCFSIYLVVDGSELTLATTLEPLRRFLDSGGEILVLQLGPPHPRVALVARTYGCTLISTEEDFSVALSDEDRSRLLATFGGLAGDLIRESADSVIDRSAARNHAAALCAADLVLFVDTREAVHLDLDAIDRLLVTTESGIANLPDGVQLWTQRSALYNRRHARWAGFEHRLEPLSSDPQIEHRTDGLWSRPIIAGYQSQPRLLNELLELAPKVERGDVDSVLYQLDCILFSLRWRDRWQEAALIRAIQARLRVMARHPKPELASAVTELVAQHHPDLAALALDGVSSAALGDPGQLVDLAELRLEVARSLLMQRDYPSAHRQAEVALISLAQGLVEGADTLRAALHILSFRALREQGRSAEAAHHYYRCRELDPAVADRDWEWFLKTRS